MIRSLQSHLEKVANAFFSSNQKHKAEWFCLSLILLFLPTQLGKHFWPDFAVVSGIQVDYLSPTLYLTDLILLVLFILWLLRIKKQKLLKNVLGKVSVALFAVGFLLLNVFLSQYPLNGLYTLLKLLEFTFFTWYLSRTIQTTKQVLFLFSILSVGVFFESLLAIAQFVKQGSINGIFYFFGERFFSAQTPGIANASINGELVLRAYGTFSHPNVLAGFLVIVMSFLLPNLSSQKKNQVKTFWVISLFLGTLALILTMSRTAGALWGVLLLVVAAYRVRQKFMKRINRQIVIPLFVILISCVVLFLITPFGNRFTQTTFVEEAFTQRIDLIEISGKLFLQNPILGVGLGGSLPSLSTLPLPKLFGYLQPVHNVFLLILVETGIVGLALFVIFLQKTYHHLLSSLSGKRQMIKLVLCVLLAEIIVLGSVDHYFLTLQQGQLLFAFILGVSWAKLTK